MEESGAPGPWVHTACRASELRQPPFPTRSPRTQGVRDLPKAPPAPRKIQNCGVGAPTYRPHLGAGGVCDLSSNPTPMGQGLATPGGEELPQVTLSPLFAVNPCFLWDS